MAKNVYILGAGDFGRELMHWLRQAGTPADWNLKGFLDDADDADPTVIGRIADWSCGPDDAFLMGLAAPAAKQKVHQAFKARGAKFLGFNHPTAVIAGSARLAEGCVLCPGALVSHNAAVGDCVLLNAYATVGHDVTVGRYSTLSCHVDVTGHVRIGEGVFMGSHACVIPSQQVGDHAVVGAGAVVIRSVEPRTTVFGNPAKRIALAS